VAVLIEDFGPIAVLDVRRQTWLDHETAPHLLAQRGKESR
jgi:hypothetical protein